MCRSKVIIWWQPIWCISNWVSSRRERRTSTIAEWMRNPRSGFRSRSCDLEQTHLNLRCCETQTICRGLPAAPRCWTTSQARSLLGCDAKLQLAQHRSLRDVESSIPAADTGAEMGGGKLKEGMRRAWCPGGNAGSLARRRLPDRRWTTWSCGRKDPAD